MAADSPIKPLLIFGARALAPEVADLVSDIAGFEVTGFVENIEPERCAATMDGLPVHWIADVAAMAATHWAVIALSTNRRVRYVEQAAALGFRFATLVHPGARVSRRSSVGEGARSCLGYSQKCGCVSFRDIQVRPHASFLLGYRCCRISASAR